jgi:PAS domain-containing protein
MGALDPASAELRLSPRESSAPDQVHGLPHLFARRSSEHSCCIASSNEPLLFLAGDLRIIAASASFCRTFQIDPASVPGRRLSELGAGEWAMPKLKSLLKATASGSAEIGAYEIDLLREGGESRGAWC